jgi:hypothetical protein
VTTRKRPGRARSPPRTTALPLRHVAEALGRPVLRLPRGPTRRPECPEESPPWLRPALERSRLEQPVSVRVRVPGRRAPAPHPQRAHRHPPRTARPDEDQRLTTPGMLTIDRRTARSDVPRRLTPIPPQHVTHRPGPFRRRRPRLLWPAPPTAAGRPNPGSAAARPPAQRGQPDQAGLRGQPGCVADPGRRGQRGQPGQRGERPTGPARAGPSPLSARTPQLGAHGTTDRPVRPPALGVRTAGRHSSRPVTWPARMRGAGTHAAGRCTTPVDIRAVGPAHSRSRRPTRTPESRTGPPSDRRSS